MSAETNNSFPTSLVNDSSSVLTEPSVLQDSSRAESTVVEVEESPGSMAPPRLIPSLTLSQDAIVVRAVNVPASNSVEGGDSSTKEISGQPDARNDLVTPDPNAGNRRVTRSRAQSSQSSNSSKAGVSSQKRKSPAKSKHSSDGSNEPNAGEQNPVAQGSPPGSSNSGNGVGSLLPALQIEGDTSSGSLTFALPLEPATGVAGDVPKSSVPSSATVSNDEKKPPATENVSSAVPHQTISRGLGGGGSGRRVRLLVANPDIRHHPTLGPPPGPPGPESIRRTNTLIESIEPMIREVERDYVDSDEQEPIEVPDVLEDSSDCDDYLRILATNAQPLIDDEAEDDCDEEDDESEQSEPDDYDRTDPFIDDDPSSEHNEEPDDDDQRRKRSSKKRHSRPRKRSRRVPSSSRSVSPTHDPEEENEACPPKDTAGKHKRHHNRNGQQPSRRSYRSDRRNHRHKKRRRSPSSSSSSSYDSDSESSATYEYVRRRSKRSRPDVSGKDARVGEQTPPTESRKGGEPPTGETCDPPANGVPTEEPISVDDRKRRDAIREGKAKARDPQENATPTSDTNDEILNYDEDPRTREMIRRAIEESRRLWEESLYRAQLEAFSATFMSSRHASLPVPGPSGSQLTVPSTPFSYYAAASLPTPLLTPSPVGTSNVPSLPTPNPDLPATQPPTPTPSKQTNNGLNETPDKRKAPRPRPKPTATAGSRAKTSAQPVKKSSPSNKSASGTPPSGPDVPAPLKNDHPEAPATSTPSVNPSSSTAKTTDTTSSSSSNPRRTFKDAMRGRPSSSKSRDLWDLPGNLPKCRPPNVCGVKPSMDRDAVLEEGYERLENSLQPAVFTKWTKNKGPGYFVFAHWGDQCPDLYEGLLLRAVTFVRHKAVVNFCRAPTSLFTAKKQGSNKGRYHLYIGNRPAVGLLLGYLDKSQLLEPDGRELRQKFVNIIPMLGEFDMFQAAICNILHAPTLSAQLGMNALQIGTRTNFELGQTRKGKTHLFSRGARDKEDDDDNGDTKVRGNGFSLDNTADVPVYDLRDHPDFNFSSDLDSIHKLPQWEDEIPVGSCVVVAHTVGTYLSPSTGKKHVTFNLQYVLLLALPAPVDEALSEVDGGGGRWGGGKG